MCTAYPCTTEPEKFALGCVFTLDTVVSKGSYSNEALVVKRPKNPKSNSSLYSRRKFIVKDTRSPECCQQDKIRVLVEGV